MNNSQSPWTKERVEEFLARLDHSYQKIELPFGLSTPGADRTAMFDVLFPSKLSGASVLDVGSYLGYCCLEASRRGATRVLGLDVDPARVAQARDIAAMREQSVEYKCGDVESLDPKERFDVVLCLNVLHHLFDPVATLRKLARMTKGTLVLEVASFGSHDGSKFKLPGRFLSKLKNTPAILVMSGVPSIGNRGTSQKYFFSPSSVATVLGEHTKLFSCVEVIPSPFKDRFILKATRRRIGHLVIVAGPTSSGKSSFLKAIRNSALPDSVSSRLPAAVAAWPQIGATGFLVNGTTVDGSPLSLGPLEGLVLHYDFLRPYTTGTHSYERDQVLDLIDCADEITVVTLRPSVGQLVRQLVDSELGGVRPSPLGETKRHTEEYSLVLRLRRKVARTLRRIRGGTAQVSHRDTTHHQKILRFYEEPRWLEHWYSAWESFLASRTHEQSRIVVEPGASGSFAWELREVQRENVPG